MPIPSFDGILNVLPPHLGNPIEPDQHSPYPCTVLELCERFASSERRRDILAGFLRLREKMFAIGLSGFQWLDGSFLEDIEAQAGRDPGDIDVVTFVARPAQVNDLNDLVTTNEWLLDRNHTKTEYRVDHFLVALCTQPRRLVDMSRYWYGLFSHRRDGVWKGMLCVELDEQRDDAAARRHLEGSP